MKDIIKHQLETFCRADNVDGVIETNMKSIGELDAGAMQTAVNAQC